MPDPHEYAINRQVLAIIPARAGSKGIPNKNFKPLAGGYSPWELAAHCAESCGIPWVVSTDHPEFCQFPGFLKRPAELAQDDTPMIAVVEHALAEIKGPPDQIILLLQPTQPLRQPKHIAAAVALLYAQMSFDGCAISVIPTESIDKMYVRLGRELFPCGLAVERRHDGKPTFKRDGTVYAWYRRSRLYARPWLALDIDPAETCSLDTEADWAEAERRLALR